MNYSDAFEALRDIYLEDSWVIAINQGEHLSFELEVVLCDTHPLYVDPREGEQYDYRSAELRIAGSAWAITRSGAMPATDASGEADLGSIDFFQAGDDGVWHLEGDWGRAEVRDPEVTLLLGEVL